MAEKRHMSMSVMMILVMMLGVDFAIIRECMHGGSLELALAILPSSNLLLFVLPNLRGPVESRKYWWIFEIVGWLMLLVVSCWFTWVDREIVLAPISILYQSHVHETSDSIPSVLIIAIYMSPQLLVAWLAATYWVRRKKMEIKLDMDSLKSLQARGEIRTFREIHQK